MSFILHFSVKGRCFPSSVSGKHSSSNLFAVTSLLVCANVSVRRSRVCIIAMQPRFVMFHGEKCKTGAPHVQLSFLPAGRQHGPSVFQRNCASLHVGLVVGTSNYPRTRPQRSNDKSVEIQNFAAV